MKETFEKLWNDYLLEKCSTIVSDEECALTKQLSEQRRQINALLNQSQQKAINQYVEALYDSEAIFVKKAFFKGCEFAVSFLLETRKSES